MSKKNPDTIHRLRVLAEEGMSDPDIAAEMGISRSTVIRWRKAEGIKSNWTPPKKSEHGRNCRCDRCRDRKAEASRETYRKLQDESTSDPEKAGTPWTPEEDEVLLDLGASSASREIGRTYAACRNRYAHLQREELLVRIDDRLDELQSKMDLVKEAFRLTGWDTSGIGSKAP